MNHLPWIQIFFFFFFFYQNKCWSWIQATDNKTSGLGINIFFLYIMHDSFIPQVWLCCCDWMLTQFSFLVYRSFSVSPRRSNIQLLMIQNPADESAEPASQILCATHRFVVLVRYRDEYIEAQGQKTLLIWQVLWGSGSGVITSGERPTLTHPARWVDGEWCCLDDGEISLWRSEELSLVIIIHNIRSWIFICIYIYIYTHIYII